MTDKGKKILKELTQAQSDLLTQRILAAMETRKSFKKSDIRTDVLNMENSVDLVHYPIEAISYGIEAIITTFTLSGMLIQEDKIFHIARHGKKVEE